MSFANNKLDPSSAAFVPSTSSQADSINFSELFGSDFTASFPDIAMDMNVDLPAPDTFAHSHDPTLPRGATHQQQPGLTTTFPMSGITLEKVQTDMFVAFSSFMQLQSEYQAKLQCVERELAKNVQEANNLRQDVDVLSTWAKAVLDYFGSEGTSKEANTVLKAQDPVV